MKTTFTILFCILSFSLFAGNGKFDRTKEAKAKEWLKNQPLQFIENRGQFTTGGDKPAENVLFKSSVGNCDIYITTSGLSYVFKKTDEKTGFSNPLANAGIPVSRAGKKKNVMYYRLDMNLEGSAIGSGNIIKEEESVQGWSNYFYRHCSEGICNVKGYGKITIKDVYKGIDWVIYSDPGLKDHPLKYDFVVNPGADYKDIRMKFVNGDKASVTDNETKINIRSIAGNLEESGLYSYQEKDGDRQKIESRYSVGEDGTVSFRAAGFDRAKRMVIDPLVWATYYGGSGDDEFYSVVTDSQDNIYITGLTYESPDFPVMELTGAYWQPTNGAGEAEDGFILKFNSQGVRQWATYYGGSGSEVFYNSCIDSQDNLLVSGCTTSSDFPTQQMAGAYWQAGDAGTWNMCVLKFDKKGERKWATYYGGSSDDFSRSMCIDKRDNIYITGETSSHDLPLKQVTGAYWQPDNTGLGSSDPFISRFDANGALVWATYYGSSDEDRGFCIRTDSQDNVYMTGYTYAADFPVYQMPGAYWQGPSGGMTDAFLLKFDSAGVRKWATYYGGSNHEIGYAIGIDKQDNVYFSGTTSSADFPAQKLQGAYWQDTIAGKGDLYLLKFNNQGVRQWATYYGGAEFEECDAICSDNQNNIYFTGFTNSYNFPVLQGSGEYWQPNPVGGQDAFIMKFNNQAVEQWATCYGGDNWDFGTAITSDSQDSVYIAGSSWGNGAYTANPGNGAYYDETFNGFRDGFILKIAPVSQTYPFGLPNGDKNINYYISQPVPNPACSYTSIGCKLPDGAANGELVVYNVLGTEVRRCHVSSGSSAIKLDTGDLPAGTYYYLLQVAGKSSSGKKLVVIR
ncbi:MAG: SBBP repeat-containing protein [Bacteroidota bacterium]